MDPEPRYWRGYELFEDQPGLDIVGLALFFMAALVIGRIAGGVHHPLRRAALELIGAFASGVVVMAVGFSATFHIDLFIRTPPKTLTVMGYLGLLLLGITPLDSVVCALRDVVEAARRRGISGAR